MKEAFARRFRTLLIVSTLWTASVGLHAADVCDYEKQFGREDKTIFGRDCALCHSISGLWEKPGGALGDLFSRKEMRSGQPVTEENVRRKIAEGGPAMPGFKHTLTAAQINELVTYLKDVKCPLDTNLQKALQEARSKTQTSSQAASPQGGQRRETTD